MQEEIGVTAGLFAVQKESAIMIASSGTFAVHRETGYMHEIRLDNEGS